MAIRSGAPAAAKIDQCVWEEFAQSPGYRGFRIAPSASRDEKLQSLYQVTARPVVHDLHPDYLTIRWDCSRPEPKIPVQHHHAHIASCMVENHLAGRVIGVAFDGTGFGTDSQIWGGGFLLCDYLTSSLRAHLRYVPLPGGDRATREGWRIAAAYIELRPALRCCRRHLPEAALTRRVMKYMNSDCPWKRNRGSSIATCVEANCLRTFVGSRFRSCGAALSQLARAFDRICLQQAPRRETCPFLLYGPAVSRYFSMRRFLRMTEVFRLDNLLLGRLTWRLRKGGKADVSGHSGHEERTDLDILLKARQEAVVTAADFAFPAAFAAMIFSSP